MTLIRKGLGALKKPLKRRGTEEAEDGKVYVIYLPLFTKNVED
jgi:hypothetical protein